MGNSQNDPVDDRAARNTGPKLGPKRPLKTCSPSALDRSLCRTSSYESGGIMLWVTENLKLPRDVSDMIDKAWPIWTGYKVVPFYYLYRKPMERCCPYRW